jgi:putative spermidine/putrescine transport system ATP-binding protein
VAGFVGVSNVVEREGRRFTIRPEKIRMLDDGEPPSAGVEHADARIREVVYVGMLTRYLVELEDGGELAVVRQNLERTSAQALEERGRRVRLEWRREHMVAIDNHGGNGGDT